MKTLLPLQGLCLFIFLGPLSPNTSAQTAYDWYQKELDKKQSNEYWTTVAIDTAIQLKITPLNASASKTGNYLQAVDLNSLLRNKMVIYPLNRAVSGQIYLTGKGFPVPLAVSWIGQPNISNLDHILKKCETGTSIIFDIVMLPDSNTNMSITGGCVLTDFKRTDLPIVIFDTSIIETMETLEKRFTRGTIYFSGAGFPVPASVPAAENNAPGKKAMIAKIQPGTIIVFDNCNYWDTAEKRAVSINKTITLKTATK